MLQARLLENGVAAQRVELIPSEAEAVNAALNMAREGDLLVIFGDNIKRCWKQVAGFKIGEGSPDAIVEMPPTQGFVQADPNAQLAGRGQLIRDERGVRIARIDEESD
jgi:cyanophycin synthetase